MARQKSRFPASVVLLWEMLNSPAYIKLQSSAAKALPYFIGKVKTRLDDPQRYAMEFSFSYREAQRLGFAPGTFSKAIKALVSFGFIDPIDKGGLRSDCKSLNVFCLSVRWKDYGKADFQYINWTCFLPKPRLKATSRKEMYSFKKGNKRSSKGVVISQIEAVGGTSG